MGKKFQKIEDEIESLRKTCIALEEKLAYSGKQSAQLFVGKVLRAGVGSYDYLVDIGEGSSIPCIRSEGSNGVPFGVSENAVISEGSTVIVAYNTSAEGIGYIVGVVPHHETGVSSEGQEQQIRVPQLRLCNKGPHRGTEQVYTDAEKEKSGKTVFCGDFRPCDVFPGEYVLTNEHGVGIDIDFLTSSICGGSARVSASRLDNTVIVSCMNFKKFDMLGYDVSSVDFGRNTQESAVSPYLGERTGYSGSKIKYEESADEKPVGRYRMKSFIGYLGGLVSRFLLRPEDNDKEQTIPRTTEYTDSKDSGLLQFNVNDNGRVMCRSAGGFVLERCDRIPVPLRVKEFSDVEGFDTSTIVREEVGYFKTPKDDDKVESMHYMPLALADKMAYEYKQTYDRFLEYIQETGKYTDGDYFSLKNEGDLDPLKNDSGIPERTEKPDEFERNTGRKSAIVLPPDGSVIIRDAWGSEIVMEGGNVYINTPGSIIERPGHSRVTIAGDDIVDVARNSIDIEALDKDVTVSGSGTVRVAAGSDGDPSRGGVVIESFAVEDTVDLTEKGEDRNITGITIKSNYSHVAVIGRKTLVGASEGVRITTGDGDTYPSGKVTIVTGSMACSAKDGALIGTPGAGVIVTDESTLITGSTAVCATTDGVTFATNEHIGVPLWIDMTNSYGKLFVKRMDNLYSVEKQDKTKNAPFEFLKIFDEFMFSFRTSEQCSTDEGIELTDKLEKFTLYQPYWAVLSKLEVGTLADIKLETFAFPTVNGESPWPGTDAVEDGRYAVLDDVAKSTLNQKLVDAKTKVIEYKKSKDGKTVTKEEKEKNIKLLCSKDYKDITGSSTDTKKDGVKIKLKGMDEYEFIEFDDSKVDKKRNKNNKNK